MNRGVIDIDKAKCCGSCAHFHQWYYREGNSIVYRPVHIGNCVHLNQKDRCTFEYCSNYVSGEQAAYLKAKEKREEKWAVEEFRQEYQAERNAEKRRAKQGNNHT